MTGTDRPVAKAEEAAAAGATQGERASHRQRLTRWLAAILIGAVFVPLVPVGSAFLASRLLANASPPTGVEFPSTPAALLASGDETTALAGQGRGLNCSIPWLVEQVAFGHGRGLANPSARYRQACVAHDLCYRHGAATYGYTQADCDQMLMRAAFRMCKKAEDERQKREDAAQVADRASNSDETYRRCVDEARMVFFGVFVGGATAYRLIEPRDEGRVAPLEGSGPAEYDAYPAGGASFSTARLVDGRTASLILFRRSPGGGKYVRRDWTGVTFSPPFSGRLPGRWEDQPAPPFVAPGFEGRPDVLVWWRRSVGARFPTNGSFGVAQVAAFNGKSQVDVKGAPPNLDPGSSQFFPVPGRSPDGMVHLIGVTEFPGTWDRCGTGTDGIQIVHITLDVQHARGHPTYRCAIHQVVRSADGPSQPERLGSYLGEPPALAFEGDRVRVTLFRRDGERRASDYQQFLSGLTVLIPDDDGGNRHPTPQRRCWRLAESEEPFFEPAGPEGLLATLTFSGPDGTVDPEDHQDARVFLRTVGPSASGSGCRGAHDAWRLPTEARTYLNARVVHIRTSTSTKLRLSVASDALVMTRVSEVGGRLQGSALVVTMDSGRVVACTQSFFAIPGPFVTGDARNRAAALQPIVGDLDRDGSPDLVLADTTGGESFGFFGVDGGGGRLGFASAGSRTAHVSKAGCERVR